MRGMDVCDFGNLCCSFPFYSLQRMWIMLWRWLMLHSANLNNKGWDGGPAGRFLSQRCPVPDACHCCLDEHSREVISRWGDLKTTVCCVNIAVLSLFLLDASTVGEFWSSRVIRPTNNNDRRWRIYSRQEEWTGPNTWYRSIDWLSEVFLIEPLLSAPLLPLSMSIHLQSQTRHKSQWWYYGGINAQYKCTVNIKSYHKNRHSYKCLWAEGLAHPAQRCLELIGKDCTNNHNCSYPLSLFCLALSSVWLLVIFTVLSVGTLLYHWCTLSCRSPALSRDVPLDSICNFLIVINTVIIWIIYCIII